MSDNLNDFIVQWNIRFRYDRKWRKKYNIPFGSIEHLSANQVDIYIDIQEDVIFEKLSKDYLASKEAEVDYKKTGKFLKERKMSKKDENALYDKIKLSIKNG